MCIIVCKFVVVETMLITLKTDKIKYMLTKKQFTKEEMNNHHLMLYSKDGK